MSFLDWLIVALIALYALASSIWLLRRKKKKRRSCSGSCSGCPGCGR